MTLASGTVNESERLILGGVYGTIMKAEKKSAVARKIYAEACPKLNPRPDETSDFTPLDGVRC